MIAFPYRCPTTGYRLEGRQAAPAAASPMITYVAEHCVACGGLHIVNPATGRLMSEERTPAPGLAAQATARGRGSAGAGPAEAPGP